ncbi:hypothetical protein [Salinicoccus halodurans]|uniref:Uncharacterized protein n=2 Tax=Salinicoccus halodurans TaxID=407035 RepID=A0ABN4G4C5_9STAP|nr:hypothetical protein [Salinicoccus halodurans]AKG75021.1 hypothetical protein AAT16_13000 [Salinicoccus halodurans]
MQIDIILPAIISALVSVAVTRWQITEQKNSQKEEVNKKRYAILSTHKLKLHELPIFLNNILYLDNLHGRRSPIDIYEDNRDRILKMHNETDTYINEILSSENIIYFDKEDIDTFVKLKKEIFWSWKFISEDFFEEEADYNQTLEKIARRLSNIINQLEGIEENEMYIEQLKIEFD